MHNANHHLPDTEPTPNRGLLPWRTPRLTPRVVTTESLTSHVHILAGPPDRSGPAFVLLHGIGMSHRYYRRLQILLARHGDTYAIDLPGFGGTPRPDRQLSVVDYAHHIHATLQKLGVDRAVVVGHSMGTQFAAELALQHPGMVSRLALLGPVVDPGHRTVFHQSLMLGLNSLRESPLGNATVFTDYVRSGLRWYLAELPVMMSYDLQSRVALVAQPVVVVRGSRDPVAARPWCEKLAATAPDGRLVEIPGKPHIVQHGGARATAAAILNPNSGTLATN